MRKNFGAKTWFYPMPVLLINTYNEDGSANSMNAAWGGIVDFNQIQINLAEHKTTDNIKRNGEFTISFADSKHISEADYLGLVSGNKVPNKLEVCNLHVEKADKVNAPIISEFALTLECKVVSINDNLQVVANIVNVSADESVLDENGEIDPMKLNIITYDPVKHNYIKLGDIVGHAFSDGKKYL